MTLREALQAVYDQHGELTPALVVDIARTDSEPGRVLHDRLEWDDGVAGDAWRRTQAQELIRSVRVIYRTAKGDQSIRAFHSVRSESGYVYRPLDVVVDDPLQRRILMADMEREWRALRKRWEHFREFADLVTGDMQAAA